jgi:hypothetical protein
MHKVTPQLMVDLIDSFPPAERDAARRDLVGLMSPPFRELSCKLQTPRQAAPIQLAEYVLRFGSVKSIELLLEAGADPNDGRPRLLTQLTSAVACKDEGRIEKLEALLEAKVETDYVERTSPPTPLIGLARSKIRGIQRYWLGHMLRASGAPPIATNEYELHVMTRLLAELRAMEAVMESLSPEDQAATRATSDSYAALVETVLRTEDPIALGRLLAARLEHRLPIELDATAALADLLARHAGEAQTPQQAAFVKLLIEAGADPAKAGEAERSAVAPLLNEIRAIDGVVGQLPVAEQEAVKAAPGDPAALVAAVLRSEDPVALSRLVDAARQTGRPLGFDPTAVLITMATQIADNPIAPKRAAFVRALLAAGAKMQSPPTSISAFEIALGYENHELIDILLDAGAKPDLASSPEMVFELMRRQGLPQLPKGQHRPGSSTRVMSYN